MSNDLSQPWRDQALGRASQLRRAAAAESPLAFMRIYLFPEGEPEADKRWLDPCPMHFEMCGVLVNASQNRGQRAAIGVPRDHAKTTLGTVAHSLWATCYAIEQFIVLLSQTEHQAAGYLADVKYHLEHNHLLRRDFPEVCWPKQGKPTPPWAETEIVTKNGVKVSAYGIGAQIRGIHHGKYRPTLVILDDAESDEQVRTKEQRQKTREWFNRVLMNAVDQKGNIHVLGTVLHHDSLLGNLLKAPGWTVRRYRAIQPDGTPLWPAKWPLALLEKKRAEIGNAAFEAEWQNNPLSPDIQVFLEERVQFREPPPLRTFTLYMGVDPAGSLKDDADYFAISVIGVDRSTAHVVYVLESFRAKLPFDQQARKVYEFYLRYKPQAVAIESNGYQKALGIHLVKMGVPVKFVHTSKDKRTRALKMSLHFDNGQIFLRPGLECLRDELVQFPMGINDDQLDALGFALEVMEDNLHTPINPALFAPGLSMPLDEYVLRTTGGQSGPTYQDMANLTNLVMHDYENGNGGVVGYCTRVQS